MSESRKPMPMMHHGIAYCTDSCVQHDGKRCKLTGFRTDVLCEPWVRSLLEENKKLRAELARVTGEEAA